MRVPACILVVLFGAAASRSMKAQSSLGLEIATMHYRGSAVDTSGEPHAHPGQATSFGIRFDQGIGKMRLGLRVSYAEPGLSISGPGLVVTDNSTGTLVESAAFLSFRVGGIGPSGAVRASLGPALHLWNGDGETRGRVGAIADLSYEWPIAQCFSGAVNVEGTLSKSWFNAADLPPDFERQVTWRYGWGVGLRYRL